METITIKKCPICASDHTYNLEVERSIVIKMMLANDINERPRSVRVTRIFTCPQKNKEFQGRLTLYDTSNNRIKSIKVIGIKND